MINFPGQCPAVTMTESNRLPTGRKRSFSALFDGSLGRRCAKQIAFCPAAIPDNRSYDVVCQRGCIVCGHSREIRNDTGCRSFFCDTGTHVPKRESGGKDMVGSAKADGKDTQPFIDQPGRDITVRMQFTGCMIKPLVSSLLKFIDPQHCLDHGCQCVLAIGNQLVRQQGKCFIGGFAQETCNRNLFFLERKKINCKPVIFLDLTVTFPFPAQGAFDPDETAKIDPFLKKGFFVFPDIAVCVTKRKLYFLKKEINILR